MKIEEVMAGGDEEDLTGSRANLSDFYSSLMNPNPNPPQHDPQGPDDPFRIINYHFLDISGHDGMNEQDIGKLGKCV
jgi:hypothetical protein